MSKNIEEIVDKEMLSAFSERLFSEIKRGGIPLTWSRQGAETFKRHITDAFVSFVGKALNEGKLVVPLSLSEVEKIVKHCAQNITGKPIAVSIWEAIYQAQFVGKK